MKIALIADIHANLPALIAVLKDIEKQQVNEIWCLGDVVGYGPFPNECVRLTQQKCARVVLGNHDDKVASIDKVQRVVDTAKEEYRAFVFRWTHEALGKEESAWLRGLPEKDSVILAGKRVALYHGSPDGINDAITTYTSQVRLEELAKKADADIVLVAHSHDVFERKTQKAVFINPGSVGRPFDEDARANYAILDVKNGKVSCDFRRVECDISSCLSAMRAEMFPKDLVRAFAEARSPADILPDGVTTDVMASTEKLGEMHNLKKPHALAVVKLSLKLFDALQVLHQLGARERVLLQMGAYLHDIGLVEGNEAHHKASRDIILAAQGFALTSREQQVVALIARYHRRAFPTMEHKHFRYLPDHHKMLVERLGALVRMADGLDRSHESLVNDITVEIKEAEVCVGLIGKGTMSAELEFGKMKADLFEKSYGRSVRILIKEKIGTPSARLDC